MIRSGLFLLFAALPAANGMAQSFHTAIAPSPAAGSIFVYPERIPLKAGGMFACQRGWAFVPLNRSRQSSDVVAVEFYRFPRSAEADPSAPPIFILNGGPGFPGLQERIARRGTFEREFQDLLDVSDIVVVGQRGIGSSKPNTLIEQQFETQPADQAWDEDKAVADLQAVLKQQRQFWLDQGVDLSGFNVLECAADVRDVATGLGYQKIAIVGGSFGSHWGMTIMRNHPELVARAVLHGMEGPDHTWDHPGWFWNVFRRVAEDAESSRELEEFLPAGGLVAAARQLVNQADAEPFTVTLNDGKSSEKKVLIDGHVMRQLARGFSGGLRSWPANIIEMHQENFEGAARMALARSRFRGRQFSTASYWMLDSGSGITDRRRAEFESDPAMDIIGNTFWNYSAGSPVWETDLGDEFRSNFKTDIPTVIVHGTWDTSTPYENAVELAPFFENSKFITVQRGSHDALVEAYREEDGFRTAVMKFVASGDMSDLPDQIELPVPRFARPKLDQDD